MVAGSPSSAGVALISSSSVLGVIAIGTTCLRITVRVSRRAFGWDDTMMIFAVLSTIVRFSINIHAVTAGYGQHQDMLSTDEYMYVNFLSWLGQIFLFTSLCLLKISIGFLIMRIKDSRKSKIFQWILIFGLVASNIEVLVVLLAECRPIKAYWDPSSGTCWPNKYRIYSIYIQVGYGILTDLIYSFMPIVIVWRLQMKLKKKLSICGLIGLGLLATVCAAFRARSLGLKTSDLSWAYSIAAVWGNVELGLGITAANLVLARSYATYFRSKTTSASPSLPSALALEYHRDYCTKSARSHERADSATCTLTNSRFDIDAESQKHSIHSLKEHEIGVAVSTDRVEPT